MPCSQAPHPRAARWRHALQRVSLGAALLAAGAAQAQWVIPAGPPGSDMQGASANLGCTDLIVLGALRVGPGGSITGVRNVYVAPTAELDLAGGTLQLSQQWDAQGLVLSGGGQVLRVDSPGCPAQGVLGVVDLSPRPIPATSPAALAALALLLAAIGWRQTRRAASTPSNTRPDRSAP